jgi:hypothetical protein
VRLAEPLYLLQPTAGHTPAYPAAQFAGAFPPAHGIASSSSSRITYGLKIPNISPILRKDRRNWSFFTTSRGVSASSVGINTASPVSR